MENLEQAFTLCAIAGGTVFILRLILQFIGGIDDGDVDGLDGDMDGGMDSDSHHAHSDVDFKFLSIQGVSTFLMMFGLVGRAMMVENGSSAIPALIAATLAGLGSLWIFAFLFRFMLGMQSSGNLDIQKATGEEAVST